MPIDVDGILRRVGNSARNVARQTFNPRTSDGRFDWRQVLDMVTEPLAPGDYWNADEGRMSTFSEMMGLDDFANMSNPFSGMFNRNNPINHGPPEDVYGHYRDARWDGPGMTAGQHMQRGDLVYDRSTDTWVSLDNRAADSMQDMDARDRAYAAAVEAGAPTEGEQAAAERRAKPGSDPRNMSNFTDTAISVSGLNATSGAMQRMNNYGRRIAK